jgi:hypothetical protein
MTCKIITLNMPHEYKSQEIDDMKYFFRREDNAHTLKSEFLKEKN